MNKLRRLRFVVPLALLAAGAWSLVHLAGAQGPTGITAGQTPGGKGASRGLPESYLATALLGRQDRVTAILQASPEEDGVDAGEVSEFRKLLTKADSAGKFGPRNDVRDACFSERSSEMQRGRGI